MKETGIHLIIFPFLLWLFLNYLFSIQSFAADHQNKIFRTISPKGGFTDLAVKKIGQDRFGFIWIATQEGIFKYDSYNFVEYNCIISDPIFDVNDRIVDMLVDPKIGIWVVTSRGLFQYNRKIDRFELNKIDDPLPSGNISFIIGDNDGNICLNFGKNLIIYNPESKSYKKILLPHNNVRSVYFAKNQEIYVAFIYDGIYKITGDSVIDLIISPDKSFLRSIFFNDSIIYTGYDGGGLKIYDSSGRLLKFYSEEKGDLSHNIVNSIYLSSSGDLWVGTYLGMDIIQRDSVITHYQSNLLDSYSLPYSSVYSIYEDSQNSFWIGTWSGGLAYHNQFDNHFAHICQHPGNYSISNNYISSICKDQEGYIWIGTERGGLNRSLTNSDFVKYISFNTKTEYPINIKTIICTKENNIYIGTFKEGFYYLNNKREYHQIIIPQIKPNNDKIYALLETDSSIWVGDFIEGLFNVSKNEHEILEHYYASNDSIGLSSNQIRAIHSSNGDLWVGTAHGLNVKQKGKKYFKKFYSQSDDPTSLSSNSISTVASDSEGNLWIGTRRGGLKRYDEESESFITYNMQDGLCGNNVNGILCDEQGYLWISTENGISRFDPKDGSVNNYNESDGLQGKQFISRAAYKSDDGILIFGGTNGFTIFSPNKIKINPIEPKPIISNLSINNRRILVGNPKSPLSKSISETDNITLNHSQSSIKLEFTADNYLNPSKTRYAYRLLGLNEIWQYGTENLVSYSKLDPGNYTFELRAANNDGIWSSEPVRLELSILLPWWKKPIALAVYLFMLVTTFIILRNNIRYRERMRSAVEIEKLKRKSEENIYQLKLQFFTNISHQFKTPLTLILSPIQRLISKKDIDREIIEDLMLVEKSSLRLKKLITQLLQFRKIDQEKLALTVSMNEIVAVCENIYSYFLDLAEIKKIDYAFHPSIDSENVWIDLIKTEDAIFNILSNAFIYTQEGGQIQFAVRRNSPQIPEGWNSFSLGKPFEGDAVFLDVSDTGIGIPPKELSKIFERFYQTENKAENSGTGIGLSLAKDYILYHSGIISVASREGEGSRFVIGLPLGKEHLQNRPNVAFSQDVNRSAFSQDSERPSFINDQKYISAPAKERKNETLLLIEDNDDLNRYLTKILSEQYHVIPSTNGDEGYRFVTRFLPDVVLCDIMLPGLTGLEICQKIKENPLTGHIPIILITALSEDVHQIEGLGKGADAYLNKPLNIELLFSTIQNMIENRKRLRISYGGIQQVTTRDENISAYDHNLIKRLQEYILENITTPEISTSQLARELNTSRTTLHRKLKSLLGMSTTEYIRRIRLEKAKEILETGDMNITEICYEVGFNSGSYFSKCFKEMYGVNPSEYKRK